MAEKKSLAEASESIDATLRKLKRAMGSELAMRLAPELDAVKTAVFAEVLDQANFPQLYEYGQEPPGLVLRAGSEQSLRDNEIIQGAYQVQTAVQEQYSKWQETQSERRENAAAPGRAHPGIAGDASQEGNSLSNPNATQAALEEQHESWKMRRTPIDGELTPVPGEIAYEFWRPREEHEPGGPTPRFSEGYALVGTVGGNDPGGEQGLHEAMQAVESQGRYLVNTGDVIKSPDGTRRRITDNGIRYTNTGIDFTAIEMTWEVMPAPIPGRREATPAMTEAKIAESVEQDAKTWKQIREQNQEGASRNGAGKEPPREAIER